MELIIKQAEPGDFEAVQRIYAGQKAIAGTLQLPFPSLELWRKRLAEYPEVFHLLAYADQEVVGHLGIHTFPQLPRRRHVGNLGMAVRDDWQGRGVGSALMQAAVSLAEGWLQLSRLELVVYTDNEPAIRLYKKIGFTIEGTHRCYAFRAGQLVDTYAMARMSGKNER